MSMDHDGKLSQKKNPKDHRDTRNIQKLVDTLQALISMRGELQEYDAETDSGRVNEDAVDKVEDMLHELRAFDITEVGSLYLTPKKRVVLDKGYGELFTDMDIELFTKEEMQNGIFVEKFEERLSEAKEEMGIDD